MDTNAFFRKLEQSLMKRALGYNCKETTKEYTPDSENDEMKIVKIKTVEKYMPPDASALKALGELQSGKIFSDSDFNEENMTEQQLSTERERIGKMILEGLNEKGGKDA